MATEHSTTSADSLPDESVGLMPAEWEPHEGCLMAWPSRQDLWSGMLTVAEEEYAGVANAIADFEKL